MLLPQIKKFEDGELDVPLEYVETKNGMVSASCNGIMLHSKYNPEREADQLVSSCPVDCPAVVFLGFGLGYAPVAFARKNHSAALIIVEDDPVFLFAAFATLDWQPVLEHQDLLQTDNAVLVIKPVSGFGVLTRPQQFLFIIESYSTCGNAKLFCQFPSCIPHLSYLSLSCFF